VAQIRCFTLRLPQELYIDLYELSSTQGKTLNATVIELIKIAMSHKVDIREALRQLLDKEFGPDAITAES
jgi:predicted DNA-binding protein